MDAEKLEQIWVEYQQNVAMLRSIIPGLVKAAFQGRQQHTFVIGEDTPPGPEIHRLAMGATPNTPHGIPNMLPSFFVGRIVSVHAAGTALLISNSLTQGLARALEMPERFRFDFGPTLAVDGHSGARAAPLLYAGANHFRHIDEWSDDADDWGNPKDEAQRKRHAAQTRSMQVIADVLGENIPIRKNLCYEIVEAIFGPNRDYRDFERNLLEIGRSAVASAGMADPQIGITITETKRVSELTDEERETYVRMCGVSRAAD